MMAERERESERDYMYDQETSIVNMGAKCSVLLMAIRLYLGSGGHRFYIAPWLCNR